MNSTNIAYPCVLLGARRLTPDALTIVVVLSRHDLGLGFPVEKLVLILVLGRAAT